MGEETTAFDWGTVNSQCKEWVPIWKIRWEAHLAFECLLLNSTNTHDFGSCKKLMTASILKKESIKLALLNWWWISLIFLLVSPSWQSKKPDAWMCIRCRERDGVLSGQEHCFSVFACASFVLFHALPLSPFHTHTPNPGHPSVYDSSSDYMEGKPWGKGASLSQETLVPRAHGESQWLLLSLSSSCLVWKGDTVAGMHSRANIQ